MERQLEDDAPTLFDRRQRIGLFIGIVLLVAPVGVSAVDDQASLPYAIQKFLLRHKISESSLSVFVQDVDAETALLNVEGETPRNPASVIKVLTTFAALDTLGPSYTWKTDAFSTASLRNGRLEGDLYLKGSGDPFLVTERFWKFLLGLRNSGVSHITGDLIIDNSFFSTGPFDPGEFDNRPERPYNVGADAMLINFGVISFWLVPDAQAHKVNITTDPPTSLIKIDNRLEISSDSCASGPTNLEFRVISREAGGSVRFSGTYPARCGRYALTRTVSTPVPYAFGVFDAMWRDLGGTIDGNVRTGKVPAKARRLHGVKSPPLAEIIRTTNKFSNNVMSRHLLLTLGAEKFGPPATVAKGRKALDQWLASLNLTFPELVIDNGAGLSRQTRISAASLGKLLLAAHANPLMPEFVSSLPLSAIDGTLRKRFRGEPLAGRAHIKTGTLDDVRAMGGYLLGPDGRTFVVVSLHNHPGIHHGLGTRVQDALLRWVFEQ